MKIKNTKLKIDGKIYEAWNVQDFIDTYSQYEKGIISLEDTYNLFREMACFEVLKESNIEIIEASQYTSYGEPELEDYIYLKNDVAKNLLDSPTLEYYFSYNIPDLNEFQLIDDLYQKEKIEYEKEGYEIGYCDFEDLIIKRNIRNN